MSDPIERLMSVMSFLSSPEDDPIARKAAEILDAKASVLRAQAEETIVKCGGDPKRTIGKPQSVMDEESHDQQLKHAHDIHEMEMAERRIALLERQNALGIVPVPGVEVEEPQFY
jgi:hypothetical protein